MEVNAFDESCYAESSMLSVTINSIMLSVLILSVNMLNVVMLNVLASLFYLLKACVAIATHFYCRYFGVNCIHNTSFSFVTH